MINIDSRLLESVDPDELYLLTRLVNRMNKDGTCFPGNTLLMSECNWSRSKLIRIKNSLCRKGLIASSVRLKDNSPQQMSNIYKLKTNLVSNYTPRVMADTPPCHGVHPGGVTSEPTPVSPVTLGGVTSEPVSINQEVLTNEVLTNEELKREKDYLSFQISNIFQDLIETFYTQFNDHKFYSEHVRFLGEYDKPIDETTLAFLKKISRAAEKIHESLKTLYRAKLEFGEDKIYRGDQFSKSYFKEVRLQVNAYHDYCRLTKTYMTTDPKKLPEKLIQCDWPFKLFDLLKDDIKNEKYDPACDKDLLSQWLIEMYYWQAHYDTWICKRYNNRIVSDWEEYLKNK